MVLGVAGGFNSVGGDLTSAELYNPTTGTWTTTGNLNLGRYNHTATLLPDGMVLVAGGFDANTRDATMSAELYNPSSGTWSTTGSLNTQRYLQTATLLPGGLVLVADGGNMVDGSLASAEL
jgi:hypothetical protein